MTVNLAQAQQAYQVSLSALDTAHGVQQTILNPPGGQPVDWISYDAASAVLTEAKKTADAAQAVYVADILDTPAVAGLLTTLAQVTNGMQARIAQLQATAASLNNLAQAADVVTNTLNLIAKFV
jgi:hypothetical protein